MWPIPRRKPYVSTVHFHVPRPHPLTDAEISLRPHTPTRPAQEPGPTFDLPPAVRVTTPTAPPPKAHLLQRALSMLRRGQRSEVEGSILSSAVGLYAAHATLLASIVIGEWAVSNSGCYLVLLCCLRYATWRQGSTSSSQCCY